MRRRVGLIVLLVLWLALVVQHVRIEHQDQNWLLNVYESRIDIKGIASDQWVRTQRLGLGCRAIQIAQEHTPAALLEAIHRYSPPDSLSARVLWLGITRGWSIAELEFDTLSPAVIILKQDNEDWRIPMTGIWSGHTHPWRPSPLIRHFLLSRNPDIPTELLRCWQSHHPIWKIQN